MAKKRTNNNRPVTGGGNSQTIGENNPSLQKTEKKSFLPQNQWWLMAKMLLVALIVISIINWTDGKRWFETTDAQRAYRSDCVDKDLSTKKIDIISIGNSHAELLDPFVIAQSFNCNFTVFGEQGAYSDMLYHMVRNVLSQQHPKLICVDTYTLFHEMYEEKNDHYYMGVAARYLDRVHNFSDKVVASELIETEKLPLAYSRTLRNHEVLFDTLLLNEGIKREKEGGVHKVPNYSAEKYLYGKFGLSFYYGQMNDSTSALFDSLGPIIDGKTIQFKEQTGKDIDRIASLCREKNVELMFYMAPIYYKVFANYEDLHFKIDSMCAKAKARFVDFNYNYDTTLFKQNFFLDNHYQANIHLNKYGIKLFTYQFANYINDSLSIDFPNRSGSKQWENDYKGKGDYQLICDVLPNDTANKVVIRNVEKDGCTIKEGYINIQQNNDVLYLKVKKESADSLLNKATDGKVKTWYDKDCNKKLALLIKGRVGGNEGLGSLNLNIISDARPVNHYLFSAGVIKGLEVMEVKNIAIK